MFKTTSDKIEELKAQTEKVEKVESRKTSQASLDAWERCRARGAEVAHYRKTMREKLKQGDIPLENVLNDPDCQGMHVRHVISAIPNVETKNVAKILTTLKIPKELAVRELNKNQCRKLRAFYIEQIEAK